MGVTTAYYLAREGCDVTVVDRQPAVAAETSRANAGMISTGHALPWASPRAPKILLKSLWSKDLGFRLRPRALPFLLGWGMRFLRECTTEAVRRNAARKHRISEYSQRCLAEIRTATGLSYDEACAGLLYYFRDAAHFELGKTSLKPLGDLGHAFQMVDTEGCVAFEPALANISDELAGGVISPSDETGDCRVFSERLTETCREMGVSFELNTIVKSLQRENGRIRSAITDKGAIEGDAFVLALGSYSPLLGRPLGLRLPIYPVKGYSLTLPIVDSAGAPRSGCVDEGRLVAFSRLGDALRLTAVAEFDRFDTSYQPSDFRGMLGLARKLFGDAVDTTRPEYWACLRPMTPDGPPILGVSPVPNLFLNTGQGHMGWTMACGSSCVVADIIVGREPAIDLDGLTYDRY